MSTASEQKPHSAEYFGEVRDFWWNSDYLELLAKRLEFGHAHRILDVGCGVGHWSRSLAPFFPVSACVVGIDREDAWVNEAAERARASCLGDRFHYQKGDATALPFGDDTFDMVTCQTVLIHLKDPKLGLSEMLRVLKPGGLILAAEPNNFANQAILSSLSARLSVDALVDRLRFELLIERGKQALGLGFNSVGDLVPGYLAELGADHIRTYLNDKATPFFPPYASEEQTAHIKQVRDWTMRDFFGWDRAEALSYFTAGGGNKDDFDRYYVAAVQDGKDMIAAVADGTYHTAGGCLTNVISARKPMPQPA